MGGEMVGIKFQTGSIPNLGWSDLVMGVAWVGEKMVAGEDDRLYLAMRVRNRTPRMLLKQPRGKNE